MTNASESQLEPRKSDYDEGDFLSDGQMEKLLAIVVRNRQRSDLAPKDNTEFEKIDYAIRLFLLRSAFQESGVERRAREIAEEVLVWFKREINRHATAPNVINPSELAQHLWGDVPPCVWLFDKIRSNASGAIEQPATIITRSIRFLFKKREEPELLKDEETGRLREHCPVDSRLRGAQEQPPRGRRPCVHRCDLLFFCEIGFKSEGIGNYVGIPRRSVSNYVTNCYGLKHKPPNISGSTSVQ